MSGIDNVQGYASEKTRIASVDRNGEILGKRPGKTRIYMVTTEMQFHYVDVTVRYNFVQWLLVIFLFGWIWVPIWK